MSAEHETDEQQQAVSQVIAVNEGRAGLYRTLAHLFLHELTQEEVESLAARDFASITDDEPLIAEGLEDMRRYLRKLNTGTRQELAVDYAHTFLAAGNYESFVATPYESVFTSELGLLMQEARDEVFKAYCAQHVQPDEALRIPEDHVSFELEFIATLLERTNAALAAGDVAQARELAQVVQSFHAMHQLNWIDDLCDAIMDAAQTRFYRGLSKLLRGWTHLEEQVMADEAAVLAELAI